MSTVRVAVLFGFGINCDHETAAVFRLVGAEAERLHVNRLIASPDLLSSYDILAIPGGFSFDEVIELMERVVRSGRRFVGVDMCEVSGKRNSDGSDALDAMIGGVLLNVLKHLLGERIL